MNFVLDRATKTISDDLHLFSVPDVNTGVEACYTREFRSLGPITHGSTIEFDIQNSSGDYINTKDIVFKITFGIVQ